MAEPFSIDGVAMEPRPLEVGDRAFIACTWLHDYEQHAQVPARVFHSEHPKLIDRLLDSDGASVLCSSHVRSTIFAWACGRAGVLHYAYVVPELRKRGVGQQIIALAAGAGPLQITHRGTWRHARFNPYLAGVVP